MLIHLYGPKPPHAGGSPVQTASKIVSHSRGRIAWHSLGEPPESPAILFFSLMNLGRDEASLYEGLPAYTMWEGAALKLNHAQLLRRLGPIAVPSHYNQLCFQASGFDPVVIPHGVDSEVWHPVEQSCDLVSIGYVSIRKNLGDVGFAYTRAFPDWERKLCTKVWTDHLDSSGVLGYMGTLPGRTVWGSMSEQELAAFVGHHRVFASAGFSDGFYLPGLEAMAAGVPPILPSFGGLLEYATQDSSWLVPTHPLQEGEVHYPIDPVLKWERVSVDAMAAAMQEALSDDALRKEKASKARVRALQFPWEKCADALVTMAEEHARR